MESDGKSTCGLWPVELIITCSLGFNNSESLTHYKAPILPNIST